MADISIKEAHGRSRAQARKLLVDMIDVFEERQEVDGKLVNEDLYKFTMTGASGTVRVDDNNMTADVDLTFFSRPFKKEIEEGIRKEIREAIAVPFDGGEAPKSQPVNPPASQPAQRPTPSRSRLGGRQRPAPVTDLGEITGIAPAGPNLQEIFRSQEPESEIEAKGEISTAKKIAIGVGVISGVTSLIVIPGPLGRVMIAAGAGYTAYRLTCDFVGELVVLGKC